MYTENVTQISTLLSVKEDDSGNYILIGATRSQSGQIIEIRKLNSHLAYNKKFSDDGYLAINKNIIIQVQGQDIYIGIDGSYYYRSTDSSNSNNNSIVKVSKDGSSVQSLTGYSITNTIPDRIESSNIVFSGDKVIVIGDYWGYVSNAGKISVNHFIGIDDGNRFVKINSIQDVDSHNAKNISMYVDSMVIDNQNYLIATTKGVYLVDSNGTDKKISNTQTYISKITTQLKNDFYVYGTDVYRAKDTDYTIKKINIDGSPVSSFGVNSELKINHLVDYMFETIDGGLILLWGENIQNIDSQNQITSTVVTHYKKYNNLGQEIINKQLDFSLPYRNSSVKYNSSNDSIDIAISSPNYFSIMNYDTQGVISFVKIKPDGSLDNSITKPIYLNSENTRFTSNGKYYAIDTNGNAGYVAKILGAVFGAEAVSNKEYVGIGLNLLDNGVSYISLCKLAADVAGLYGNDKVVTTLWHNVVGTVASTNDKAPFIGLLESGTSIAELVQLAADTQINGSNINLIGLSQSGIEYLPVG